MEEFPNSCLVLLGVYKKHFTTGPSGLQSHGQESICGHSPAPTPAPVSRSLDEAGWTDWHVRLRYLWNSISPTPCDSQEPHREAAERILSGPRRGIQWSNKSNIPQKDPWTFQSSGWGTRKDRTKDSKLGVKRPRSESWLCPTFRQAFLWAPVFTFIREKLI